MRTLLTTLIIFVSLVGFTQPTTDFNVSGKLLNASGCEYLLYDIAEDGKWRLIDHVELESMYSITVKPYRTYLIIFTTSDDEYRHMYLSLNEASIERMDLNFEPHPYPHPIIYYDELKQEYLSYSVNDAAIGELYEE